MGFYVRYVAFVLNLLSRTWIGLPSPYRSFASLPSIAEQLVEPEPEEAPAIVEEEDEEEPPIWPLEPEDPPPIVEELPQEPLLGSFWVGGVRRSRRLEGRVVNYRD